MLNLNCVICAELFTQSDDVHVTTCGHMFHFLCLKQWLERSKTCPQCRNKCSDRNIFRVYFNLANLDVSRIDVGSLQDQLDNANLQLKMKEKELNKAEEQIKSAKETQKKCMKTIAGLEKEVKSNNFVVLNYVEKIKVLQNQVKTMDSLRDEVTSLKAQIESLNGINTLLTASTADAEKLLKTESDPKVLSVCIATLKRELRVCEHKKADIRNQLKAVQNDLRKERDINKSHEERISQLESENYNLLEKIKSLEATGSSKESKSNSNGLDNLHKTPFGKVKEEKRYTISPTIKENIKKIEESSSPYLNIKSSSVGLVPLFKRNLDNPAKPPEVGPKVTTAKITTLKISPSKTAGAVRKAKSDLGEKYSIFKKPRMGLSAAAGAGAKTSSMKPLGPNFVFNGFGGSERVDPFAENSDDSDVIEIDPKASETESTVPSTKLSIHNRLKTGGLRNFKLTK
ncbi:E3 ubiquitin-protein ligase TRAIP [Musca domestica]|uniref:E3 ubiquitin-protein ligase TRAIP n=1 Tax=Musca domestica TaxID=7370 RepID=A0A9J7D141_MUSDO|nr:E3 ubiquitin-protein ligase TRAIP [Musca domestica]